MTPSIDQTLHQFANLLPNWTLLPFLTLLPNFGGFHRTLQRVRLANRGRLLLRTSDFSLIVTLIHHIQNFETSLIKRGYSETEIKESVNDVLSNYNRQDQLIRKNKCDSKFGIPLVMVTKYNPCVRNIKRKLLKYWHVIKNDAYCNNIFKDAPIIAYQRHRNLGDILTSSIL